MKDCDYCGRDNLDSAANCRECGTAFPRVFSRPPREPFRDFNFQDFSAVKASFSISSRCSGLDGKKLAGNGAMLIARFAGPYSESITASHICGLTQAAVMLLQPMALILDFRQLDYTWGNAMTVVLQLDFDFSPIPMALLGSVRCLPAIATLMFGTSTKKRATEQEGVFDSFDASVACLENQILAGDCFPGGLHPFRKCWGLRF